VPKRLIWLQQEGVDWCLRPLILSQVSFMKTFFDPVNTPETKGFHEDWMNLSREQVQQ
jgi:hypothetical protein